MKAQVKIPFLSRASAWVLLLAQVLQIYGPSYNKSFYALSSLLFGGIYLGLRILGNKPYNKMPKEMWYLFGYMLLVHFISFPPINQVVPIDIFLIFVFCFFFFETIDHYYFIKIYSRLGVVFIAFFLIQFVFKAFSGVAISGIIPGLPIALNVVDYSSWAAIFTDVAGRSSSFFSEPAHFAEWLLPLLTLKLFYKPDHKSYIYAGVIVLVLIMLRSGTAIAGLLPISILWFIKFLRGRINFLKKIGFIVLASAALLFIGYKYLESEAGAELLNRANSVSATAEMGSDPSAFIRFYRGFYVIKELSLKEKLIGIHDREASQRHLKNNEMANMFGDNDTFMNTYQSMIFNLGYLGAIFFLIIIFRFMKGNTSCGKTLLFTYLFISVFSPDFFSSFMYVFFVLAYRLRDEKNYTYCLSQNNRNGK